jgi:hypothetical protein
VSAQQTSTASCFKTYPESDMMRWTLERAEDVYHSSTREPLGRGWVRGHKLPEGHGTEIPFGLKVNAKQNNAMSLARQAIAPVDGEYEVRLLTSHQAVHRKEAACPCPAAHLYHVAMIHTRPHPCMSKSVR